MTEALVPVKFEDTMQVYSGKSGKCYCGCSGKHTYVETVKELGKVVRGYDLDSDDVNDRVVKRHINTINRAMTEDPKSVEFGDEYVAYDNGKRIIVAYKMSNKVRMALRAIGLETAIKMVTF